MSDDKAQQEPSMEDILASIRRILSEDEAEEKQPDPQPAPAPAPASSPQDDIDALFADPPRPAAPVGSPQDDIDALFAAAVAADEPKYEPEPEPEPVDDVFELTDDMALDPPPAPVAPIALAPKPRPAVVEEDDSLLSPPTSARGTSLLSDLAREITRHRSVNPIGNGSITLEDMVREMLKPVLKQWLDDNLPGMIERIVKSEIEKMVNRAENQ